MNFCVHIERNLKLKCESPIRFKTYIKYIWALLSIQSSVAEIDKKINCFVGTIRLLCPDYHRTVLVEAARNTVATINLFSNGGGA